MTNPSQQAQATQAPTTPDPPQSATRPTRYVVVIFLVQAVFLIAVVLFFRKKLFETRWFQVWCMALTPSGFIAVIAGWFVTEIGRQPYIVYEVLRTSDTVSPVIGPNIALSLLAFIITYTFVFGAGSYYILRLIGKGPEDSEKVYGDHGVKTPPLVTDLGAETEGGKNV